MRLRRLLEAGSLAGGVALPPRQPPGVREHPPDAGGTDRDDVGIQHHEGQAAIALQGMLGLKVEDGLLLPVLQPEVPGNPTVVLVDPAVALPPVVELAGAHAQPADEAPGADLGGLGAAPDEIHDLIPHIVGHPDPAQSSPRLFLAPGAPPSARPGPRPCAGSSVPDRRCVPAGLGAVPAPSVGRPPPRSRTTPSATGRTWWAANPARHRGPRALPLPAGASSAR